MKNKYQEALDFLAEECREIKQGEAQKYIKTLQELINLSEQKIRIILSEECGITDVYSNYPNIDVDIINEELRYSDDEDSQEVLEELEREAKTLKRITSVC